jgi:hypothetical protein
VADFVKLAATAKRLIEKNGRTLSLYKRSTTPANALQPWRGTAAADADGDPLDLIVCVVPASGSGFGRERVVDGELAEAFSEVGLIAASSVPAGVDLERFSSLVDGKRAWKINKVGKLQPADVPLVFVLELSS